MRLSLKYRMAEEIYREVARGMDPYMAKLKLIDIGFYDIWFHHRIPGPLVIVGWLDGLQLVIGGPEA